MDIGPISLSRLAVGPDQDMIAEAECYAGRKRPQRQVVRVISGQVVAIQGDEIRGVHFNPRFVLTLIVQGAVNILSLHFVEPDRIEKRQRRRNRVRRAGRGVRHRIVSPITATAVVLRGIDKLQRRPFRRNWPGGVRLIAHRINRHVSRRTRFHQDYCRSGPRKR